MSETLVFNDAALHELLASPVGVVARDLIRRSIRVEAQAKTFASGTGGGPNVRTGRLRGSITHELGSDALSVFVDVGSNVEYAPYVELGTQNMYARPFLRPALVAAH
jgi:phage gpG-like protein